MSGMHRTYGLSLALTALAGLAAPAASAPAAPSLALQDEVQETFRQAVDLLQRGRDEEALRALQKVLALDPSQEQAYELWKSTDHKVWLEILSKQGDFELIGKRLAGLARMGRMERRNDAEAIRALVGKIRGDDPIGRRAAVRQLAAEHGEYAVPYMLRVLADRSDDDRRVVMMQSLTEMNTDVVPPLIEALDAPDAFLRRNVALTLGNIGDRRAAGALAWHAANDPDGAVQQAAREAVQRMGVSQQALPLLLEQGKAYALRHPTVLGDAMYSDVVWSWDEGGLVSRRVPREVYNDEMAKRAYYLALRIDPASRDALAGLARAYVSQLGKIEALDRAGIEVGDLREQVEAGLVVASLAGSEALDRALVEAIGENDVQAAISLARVLGHVAAAPTDGLRRALQAGDAALRSQAAISLARTSLGMQGAVDAEVVRALGETAGREIARLALVVDANAERAAQVRSTLQQQGMSVVRWDSGAKALAMLRRIPGVDLLVLAESLPDMTSMQVIDEVRADPRNQDVPVLVLSAKPEEAAEAFGEKATAVVAAGDVGARAQEALTQTLNRDREEADVLATRAAEMLAQLAAGGADVSAAVEALAAALKGRPDRVALPAAKALAYAGADAQVPPLVSVVVDGTRSEELRAAAADALGNLLARGAGSLPADATGMLREALTAEGTPLAVRKALARALGAARLEPGQRAELLRAARVDVATAEG